MCGPSINFLSTAQVVGMASTRCDCTGTHCVGRHRKGQQCEEQIASGKNVCLKCSCRCEGSCGLHDRGECPDAGRKDYLGFCKKCKKAAGLGAGKLKKAESEEGTAEEGRIDLRAKSTGGKKKVESTGGKKKRKRTRKKGVNRAGLVAVAKAPEALP